MMLSNPSFLKLLWLLTALKYSNQIWLEFYQAPNFTKSVKKELLSMSSATIDRYLRQYKAQFRLSLIHI